MIIVLIHWRIKLGAEQEFFDYWKYKAEIDVKSGLAGEFLSAPLPANELPFKVDDLSIGPGLLDCKHYMNVGIWKNWEEFHEQVGKYMIDDKPMQPFEADRRTRIVLKPCEWRIGEWSLPSNENCE